VAYFVIYWYNSALFPQPATLASPFGVFSEYQLFLSDMFIEAACYFYVVTLSDQQEALMSAIVSIIMGSRSDWPTMSEAAKVLDELGVAYETNVVSAHRTPARLMEFVGGAHERGIKVIIAGAGGAAHLPGMAAAITHLPVVGVPVSSKQLKGMDSLLSIVQMPRGVAVATQAIGEAGAYNAGLIAAQMLALSDSALSERIQVFRKTQTDNVPWSVE
jgi:5-(carboxyamino)imidazole ribonucleotide mutase